MAGFWTHWGCLRLSFIYCWRKCTGFMDRVSSIQHPQSLNVQVCRGHISDFAISTAHTIPPLFLYCVPPSLHPSTSPYLSTYFRFLLLLLASPPPIDGESWLCVWSATNGHSVSLWRMRGTRNALAHYPAYIGCATPLPRCICSLSSFSLDTAYHLSFV